MPKVELGISMPTQHDSSAGYTDELRKLAAAPIGASMLFEKPMDQARLNVLANQLGGKGWYTTRTEKSTEFPDVVIGVRIWKRTEPTRLKPKRGGDNGEAEAQTQDSGE